MLSYTQARNIIEKDLKRQRQKNDVKVYDEFSIELDSGWVFFYNSIDLSKGNYLVGNAPYIVNKFTSNFHVTGTAEPIEYYIDDYEEELNGRKNIWSIQLINKVGFSKFYKAYKLYKQSAFYYSEIWEMINSYPNIIKEGEIRKILPLQIQLERVGIKTILKKKSNKLEIND